MQHSHVPAEPALYEDEKTAKWVPSRPKAPESRQQPDSTELAPAEDVSFEGLEFQGEMVRDPTSPPAVPGAPQPQGGLDGRPLIEREPRYIKQLPVLFGEGVALDTYGSTSNVSRRGLELKGRASMAVGAKVSFVLRLPDHKFVRGVGEVIWTQHRRAVCLFGVAVLVADPAYWAFLEQLEHT